MDTRTVRRDDPSDGPSDSPSDGPSDGQGQGVREARPAASPGLDTADVLLVYDGECPVCSNYVRVARIRRDIGRLVVVDAREDTPIMREITAAGLDIDEGMVLKLGDALYHGGDAIHMLALIGSRSGALNRLNHLVFRSPRAAHALYPLLRAGRAALLKLLGRTRVNNLGVEGNERF